MVSCDSPLARKILNKKALQCKYELYFTSCSVTTHYHFAILRYIKAPGHWTGGRALASNRGSPVSITDQCMWGLWWTKCPRTAYLKFVGVFLSLSFHICSISIHSPSVLYNLSLWVLRLTNTHLLPQKKDKWKIFNYEKFYLCINWTSS